MLFSCQAIFIFILTGSLICGCQRTGENFVYDLENMFRKSDRVELIYFAEDDKGVDSRVLVSSEQKYELINLLSGLKVPEEQCLVNVLPDVGVNLYKNGEIICEFCFKDYTFLSAWSVYESDIELDETRSRKLKQFFNNNRPSTRKSGVGPE